MTEKKPIPSAIVNGSYSDVMRFKSAAERALNFQAVLCGVFLEKTKSQLIDIYDEMILLKDDLIV